MNWKRQRWWIAVLVAAVFTAGLIGSLKKGTSELPVYVLAGKRMLAGEPIYRPTEPKPFTYPPFFAVPFIPLGFLASEAMQRAIWYLINVAVLAWIVVTLDRAFTRFRTAPNGQRAPPTWLFWCLLAVLAGRHVTSVFENQSHDLLILACVVLASGAGLAIAEPRAGAWAGIGAACKATPALFGPVFVWQRRFRAAVAVAIVAVAVTLLPDLLFPAKHGSWVGQWYDSFLSKITPGQTASAAGAWAPWNKLNQNLAGSIYRLSTPVENSGRHLFDVSLWNPDRQSLAWLTVGAQLLVLAVLCWVTRPSLTSRLDAEELRLRRLGEGGAIASAMVLLSPMSSKSHFCVLLLPLAVCLVDVLYRDRDRIVIALLGVVFLTGTLTSKGILGNRLGDQVLARGSVTLCAIVTLAAVSRVLLSRARARDTIHGQWRQIPEDLSEQADHGGGDRPELASPRSGHDRGAASGAS